MNKEPVTERQAISTITTFLLGTALITGVAKKAGENGWLALIIAMVVAFPIQLMFARMLANFPGKNILEITEMIFGKIISRIIAIFFLWNAVFLGPNLLKLMDQFINIIDLNRTPEIMIITLATLFIILMLKYGIRVYARWSEMYLYLIIIAFIIITSFLTPLKKMDNIIPVLYDGWGPVMNGAIDTVVYPLTQTVVFLFIFTNFTQKKSYYKVFSYGTILGFLLLLLVTCDVIMVIGRANFMTSLFPPYVMLRRLHIGQFFQRVEMLVIIIFLIVGTVKIVGVYFSALISITHIFGVKDYRTHAMPVGLLFAILAYLTYANFLQHDMILSKIYIPFAYVANIGVPFIIFVAEEIYIRLKKPKDSDALPEPISDKKAV